MNVQQISIGGKGKSTINMNGTKIEMQDGKIFINGREVNDGQLSPAPAPESTTNAMGLVFMGIFIGLFISLLLAVAAGIPQ